MSHPTNVERVKDDYRVVVNRVTYAEYPYDHFLFVTLPGGRTFVYRDESDDWLICELKNDWTANFLDKAFAEVDQAVAGRIFRLPSGVESPTSQP